MDGQACEAERRYIDRLRAQFQSARRVADEAAMKIVEVLLVKNGL